MTFLLGGAGVHAHSSLFISGAADFKGCTAKGSGGGGAHTKSHLMLQNGGSLSCANCHGKDGGCVRVRGRFEQQKSAEGTFRNCTAARFGGALSVEAHVAMHGSSRFVNCTSGKKRGPDAGAGMEMIVLDMAWG